MVGRAAAKGRTTSAKTVQASQVFSQAHLRAYFMGIVKLAFVTPAMIRIAIPLEVLLMVGILPLSVTCFRFETRSVEHAHSTTGILKDQLTMLSNNHRIRFDSSMTLSCNIN